VLVSGCVSGKKYGQLEQRYRKTLFDLNEANEKKDLLQSRVADLENMIEEQKEASEHEIKSIKDAYDELVVNLENELEAGKIEIKQVQDRLQLTAAERLFFNTGKVEIKPDGQEVLKRIGPILKKLPEKNIRIEGHTDNVPIGPSLSGLYPTNWELAAARAVTVARFLQKESKIDPLRLSAVSYGQYRPIASNKTESGRATNRRIEILLVDRDMEMAKKYLYNLPAK
jgi:chemotaxis protein MotB